MNKNEDIYAKWLAGVKSMEPVIPDESELETRIMSSLTDKKEEAYKKEYNAVSAIKMLSGIAASAVLCSMFIGIYKENKPVNYTKQNMAFTDNIKMEYSDKNVFDAYRCFIKEYANSSALLYIKKHFSQHKNQEL